MSDLSYSVDIDRGAGIFNFNILYSIDGYHDPETSEYFGNTSWTATYGSGGTGGYGVESESITLEFGLGVHSAVQSYVLDFTAMNTFSAVSVSGRWNIIDANLSTPQSVSGTSAVDVIIGGLADDVLRGLGGNDIIDGGDGDDVLDGGAGADDLRGGAGDDIMAGGAGDDIYVVDSARDLVAERASEGNDTVRAFVNFVLPQNVEGLVLDGAATTGTGNDLANRIQGNALANTLSGGGGNDQLSGLGGNDTLSGGAGDDVLDGSEGADAMNGGAGNDIYWVDSSGDRVIESAGGGIDETRVFGLSSYTLAAHVENLTVASNAVGFRGIGNDLGNVITGASLGDTLEGRGGDDVLVAGAGNDLLLGGAGADSLRGGDGRDTASYSDSLIGVTANLATGTGIGGTAQGDSFQGIENLAGSAYDDLLTGDTFNNSLSGGAGADRLSGGAGDDVVTGGAGGDRLAGEGGIDTLSYAGSTVRVVINLSDGTASGGDAQGDTFGGFENVTGGNGNDVLTGDYAGNTLIGGAGADQLNGRDGNDVIGGGAGADVLDGGAHTDTVSYSGSVGGVTVDLSTQAVSGGDAQGDRIAGFENATGGNGNDVLRGNNGANVLYGGAGADTISGSSGDDRINGMAGADTLDGGAGADTLTYSGSTSYVLVDLAAGTAYGLDANGDTFSGFEHLEGGEAGDSLYGDSQANSISGRMGFDYLDGRGGNDTLAGGAQDDTFVFGFGYGHDRITDFFAGPSSTESIFIALGSAYDSFAEVMAVAFPARGGADTVFRFDAATSLTLLNVSTGSLTADDFVFQTG